MPKVHGKNLTREEYLRRVGDPDQAFGVREIEYASGKLRSVRAWEINNAGGLCVTVGESKGLDLLDLRYKGVSFGFVTKAGLSSPWIADEQGMAYRGCLGAGFMYTAGLSNVGGPCEEDGFYHYAHGALKNTPAVNVCAESAWKGDDCILRVRGEVRDAQFFGRNLLLKREIATNVGEKSLHLCDTVENQGFRSEQIMLLYHMNLGFPILDEDAVLYAPVIRDEPLSAHTKANDKDFARMIPPIDGNEEYLHALTLKKDARGYTLCVCYNPRLKLGICLRFNADVLRYLIEWKCMASGDYALGVLPSTCKPLGRKGDREIGEAQSIAPFEHIETHLDIIVVDGDDELCMLRKEIDAMQNTFR